MTLYLNHEIKEVKDHSDNEAQDHEQLLDENSHFLSSASGNVDSACIMLYVLAVYLLRCLSYFFCPTLKCLSSS